MGLSGQGVDFGGPADARCGVTAAEYEAAAAVYGVVGGEGHCEGVAERAGAAAGGGALRLHELSPRALVWSISSLPLNSGQDMSWRFHSGSPGSGKAGEARSFCEGGVGLPQG